MEDQETDSTKTLFPGKCKVCVNSTNGKLPSLELICSYIWPGFHCDICIAKPVWSWSVQELYRRAFLEAHPVIANFSGLLQEAKNLMSFVASSY